MTMLTKCRIYILKAIHACLVATHPRLRNRAAAGRSGRPGAAVAIDNIYWFVAAPRWWLLQYWAGKGFTIASFSRAMKRLITVKHCPDQRCQIWLVINQFYASVNMVMNAV